MLASIAILSSTDHMAESIGFIGHRSPPIGSLFGLENMIWDLKPAKEIRVAHWASVAGLRSMVIFRARISSQSGGNDDL